MPILCALKHAYPGCIKFTSIELTEFESSVTEVAFICVFNLLAAFGKMSDDSLTCIM